MSDVLRFRSKIVQFLSTDSLELLSGTKEEDWTRNLRWLDRSGLALPLAARFEALQPGATVPSEIRAALRSRLTDNHKRMERMLEYFRDAVCALDSAGAQCCCVKGFSLIPDCFDCIRERHQVDLDFLISPQHLTRAQSALEALGYRAQRASDPGEVRLVQPWRKHLGANAYLYQLPEPPPIELHTQVWEAGNIVFPSLCGFLDATEVHEVSGVEFRRLRPAHHFAYLLLHIFRHLLGSSVRLLSLYEVAIFVRSRDSEAQLWTEIKEIFNQDKRLASACALILGLVVRTFPTELPRPLHDLREHSLSEESALWIQRCSASWLYAEPPGNKLPLLVQQQFWEDRRAWRRYLVRRLLPIRRPHPLSDEATEWTKRSFAYRREDIKYQTSRVWYHLRSDCEYLFALWRWMAFRRVDGRSEHRTAEWF